MAATVKLTKDEARGLIAALEAAVPTAELVAAVFSAIPADKALALTIRREAVSLTRAEKVALIKAVVPLIPGATAKEKIAFAVKAIRPAFVTKARFDEVMAYVVERVKAHFASPTVPANPDPETPAATGELSDAEAQAIIAKLQFLSGKKTSPDALRLVKRFGTRITHFGGGNDIGVVEDTLWKPDGSNGLVVILPSHVAHFDACSFGGEKIVSMSIGNGYRPHIRFKKSGGAYAAGVLDCGAAGSCRIASPGKRQSFKLSVAATPDPVTPADPVADTTDYPDPCYAPGKLIIPSEFIQHGKITELRLARVSLANGGLKAVAGSPTTFTVAAPGDAAWQEFANGAVSTGTRCKCADGSQWDGYLHNNTESVPMPILDNNNLHGHAFWVKL